jgi:hypothetical protein
LEVVDIQRCDQSVLLTEGRTHIHAEEVLLHPIDIESTKEPPIDDSRIDIEDLSFFWGECIHQLEHARVFKAPIVADKVSEKNLHSGYSVVDLGKLLCVLLHL